MNWRAYLLITLSVLILIAGALYVAVEPPYPGIFDANLQRLAESQREGYCSGQTYWQTRGEGNDARAAKCRQNNGHLSNAINHGVVVGAFCDGMRDAGLNMQRATCEGIVNDSRWWPTYHGSLSRAFDENYPYPGDGFGQAPIEREDNSRTGDRGANERQVIQR